jgi:cysteine desulfurase NifS/selenium donor protein
MDQKPIYLDYNATTPIDPEVAEAMLPYLYGRFGNPSSNHPYGTEARQAVIQARSRVAALLGCRAEEIVFTGGGSESNNTVIHGVARQLRDRGKHIITSAIEHPAILEPLAALAQEGYRVTKLRVDGRGRVDPDSLTAALTPETILVTIMHANNEVGTIQPIEDLAKIARERGVLFHTDAAQSVGKIPVEVGELGVDFLSVAGHKLCAPKGVGALYVRAGLELPSLIRGASHETGRRAGTENVLEIVGLGAACEIAARDLTKNMTHYQRMRDRLAEALSARVGDLRRNGDVDHALPNTLSVCFRGVEANTLLAEIGDRVAASAGAACHAGDVDISAVLEAMAVPLDYAMGAVRFSVGRETTPEEIDEAARMVGEAVRRLAPAGGVLERTRDEASAPVVRLTQYTHGMGCACKLSPQDLERVLKTLPGSTDKNVLVDARTSDDAAVYRLNGELAVVQSVDFFTPIVDDPFDFGAVSAANSLSDLYAMGARPIFALNIAGFPTSRLPLEVLERILSGAVEVAREAGISIIGGHTIEDPEPKFGLAVTGLVHPERILTNAGAHAGDVLILTKPIGTGILATAAKKGLTDTETTRRLVAVMRRLNKEAAEAAVEVGVHAVTDVTGFGLLGHLREMAVASELDAVLSAPAVPILDGARELTELAPGGTLNNLKHASTFVDWNGDISRSERLLLCDAQTSGGLLIAVEPDRAPRLLAVLAERSVSEARIIGHFESAGTGRLRVRFPR